MNYATSKKKHVRFTVGCVPLCVIALVQVLSTSCRTVAPKVHTEQEQTSTHYADTVVEIAERSDTFYLTSPIERDTIIKSNGTRLPSTGRLAVRIISPKKVEVVCQEEQYKLRLDSVLRSVQTKRTVKDIVTISKCDSQLHAFGVWFTVVFFALVFLYVILKAVTR